ncbi:MAG: hypothetical protein NVV70_08380 [Cellulomonas sp.]|uniref:Uncharacterized protein n=1 Tax=Cellulomonas gelida TaxID=1712 RepID=A0A4Y3KJK8_9CELL|nr:MULTISPECIES: hypothetical protein [Cellulomonas]MCR6648142.1 hypothetical protein [Cellulomonas sp.]MCR6704074.1 hypothetical protein [Cellulomonas sp.]GEA84083.1 hypothetical protein CGE01nite_13340 [Cellulomonas gelida]GGL23439.1 hypothetical protein GCM10009774_12240 [Cellulomonas gelida]
MKFQITMAVRSSDVLPTRFLAPTYVGLKGRAVPASWRVSISASRKRHNGTALDVTALDPSGASMV